MGSNISEYISYLFASGKDALASDPTTWTLINFQAWKHQGKPTSNVVPSANASTPLVPAEIAPPTSAAEK